MSPPKVTGVVRWEDPPPHGNRKPKPPAKYQAVADALRASPGRWAVVAEDIPTGTGGTFSHRIRIGLGPWTPAGAFEARVVGPAAGKCRVYARYVGGGDVQ